MSSHDNAEPYSMMSNHNDAELHFVMSTHENVEHVPARNRERSASVASVSTTDSFVIIYTPTSTPPQSPSLKSTAPDVSNQTVTPIVSREEILQYSHDIGNNGRPLRISDISRYFQDRVPSGLPLHSVQLPNFISSETKQQQAEDPDFRFMRHRELRSTAAIDSPTSQNLLLPTMLEQNEAENVMQAFHTWPGPNLRHRQCGKPSHEDLFSELAKPSLREYLSGLTNLADDADRFGETYPEQEGYGVIARLVRDEVAAANASSETWNKKTGFQKFYENQLSTQKAATTAFRQTGRITHIDPGPAVQLYGPGRRSCGSKLRRSPQEGPRSHEEQENLEIDIKLARLENPSPLYDQLRNEVRKWYSDRYWETKMGEGPSTSNDPPPIRQWRGRLSEIIQESRCQSLEVAIDWELPHFRYPDVRDKVTELALLRDKAECLAERYPSRTNFGNAYQSLNTEILSRVDSKDRELQPLQKTLLVKDLCDSIDHFEGQIVKEEKHTEKWVDRQKKKLSCRKALLMRDICQRRYREEANGDIMDEMAADADPQSPASTLGVSRFTEATIRAPPHSGLDLDEQKRRYISGGPTGHGQYVETDGTEYLASEIDPGAYDYFRHGERIDREIATNEKLEESRNGMTLTSEETVKQPDEHVKAELETRVHELEDQLLNETWMYETRAQECQRELATLNEENQRLTEKVTGLTDQLSLRDAGFTELFDQVGHRKAFDELDELDELMEMIDSKHPRKP